LATITSHRVQHYANDAYKTLVRYSLMILGI